MILQRTSFMVALSAVLGLAGAWLIGQWVGSAATSQTVSPDETVPVLVVTEDIPAWESLTPTQFRTVFIPKALVSERAVMEMGGMAGQYAQVDLFAGEILLNSRITPLLPTSLLAERLDPGMRAMTVRVNDVSGVAGFVQPGSHVDVIATRRNESRLLLTNRRVLAIDQTTTLENDEPVVARTTTLAVTPEEATRLAKALGGASLYLALRNPEEPAAVPVPKPAPRGLILQRGVEVSWIKINQ